MTVPPGNAGPCLETLLLAQSWGMLPASGGLGAGTLRLSTCPAGVAPSHRSARGKHPRGRDRKEGPPQSQGARETQGPGAANAFPVPSQRRPLGCLTPTGTL